jgi:hypothetical protein
MSKYLGNLKVGSFSFKFNAVILYTMPLGQHGAYFDENNLELIADCHRNGSWQPKSESYVCRCQE